MLKKKCQKTKQETPPTFKLQFGIALGDLPGAVAWFPRPRVACGGLRPWPASPLAGGGVRHHFPGDTARQREEKPAAACRNLRFPTNHPQEQTASGAMEMDGFSSVLQESPPLNESGHLLSCLPIPAAKSRLDGSRQSSRSCLQPSCKQPHRHPSPKCWWTGLQRVAKTISACSELRLDLDPYHELGSSTTPRPVHGRRGKARRNSAGARAPSVPTRAKPHGPNRSWRWGSLLIATRAWDLPLSLAPQICSPAHPEAEGWGRDAG